MMKPAGTLCTDYDRAAALARLIVLFALILIPATARAQQLMAVGSDIFIERLEHRADGSKHVRLEPAVQPRSGDRLIFRVQYQPRSVGNEGRKMLTSAVPESISFSAGGDIVSVDGGRRWGRLEQLSVSDDEGRTRRAVPADVTHVRWMVDNRRSDRANLLFRGQVR